MPIAGSVMSMQVSVFDELWRSVSAWAILPAAEHQAPVDRACPACGALAGKLALLTAWDVYYSCGNCPHRWSTGISRE